MQRQKLTWIKYGTIELMSEPIDVAPNSLQKVWNQFKNSSWTIGDFTGLIFSNAVSKRKSGRETRHKQVNSVLQEDVNFRSDIFWTLRETPSFTAQRTSGLSLASSYSHKATKSSRIAFMMFTLVSLNPRVFSFTTSSIAETLSWTLFDIVSRCPDRMNAVRDFIES
jgi:hypothetical protein